MNGDKITVIFSDAVGAEWCDAIIEIHTAAQLLSTIATNVDGIAADVDALESRLTASRATKLDNLDAAVSSRPTLPAIVSGLLVNFTQGVMQSIFSVTQKGETITVSRGDYIKAGELSFNFGSAYGPIDNGRKIHFCIKKTRAGTKLIDVECVISDNINVIGNLPDIDLEKPELPAGEYIYEYERVEADGKKPRTPLRGKFIIEQDVRQ